MLHDTLICSADNADEWALRSEFWLAQSANSIKPRKRRERNSNALILTGHGNSMRIENGALLIKQGFSHYPQKAECYRYFKGDLDLPRIIILLDGSGSLSFDVLNWLGEQGTALARIKWDGDVAVFASGAGFSADTQKLQWQFDMRRDQAKRLKFASDLIGQKLRNSVEMLQSTIEPHSHRETAIRKANHAIQRLKSEQFADMGAIRAIEGECALVYFAAWSHVEMQWMAQGRFPVPDQWRSYQSRSSILTGRRAKNWKAAHPINAMLNYAYAVKAAQLQIQAVADGFDPYAGIMHHSRHGFPAYVYDLIEPERPKIDAAIVAFAQSRSFSGADFMLRMDGVCRLSPQLARIVAQLV